MDNETKLTTRLVKAWREMHCEVLNIHGGGYMQAPGWPDVFICSRVWSGWIEFKGPKTPIEAHQKRILTALSVDNNAWFVRFTFQAGRAWCFEIMYENLIVAMKVDVVGTDGQVAAVLLKELRRLDT